MPATFDLPAVRQFTDDLDRQVRRCDNGEGMMCDNLATTIDFYVKLCADFRGYVNQWAHTVFAGQIAFDPDVENLMKERARQLLHRVKQIAAHARETEDECFLELDKLHWQLADLDYLLQNWVRPRLAVSPAPRVAISDAAGEKIKERLKKL